MPLTRFAMHAKGEQVHAAVWPEVPEIHQLAGRHYAFEGRCFVLAAGSLMKTSALPRDMEVHPKDQGEWALRGGSMIIAPDGKVLAGPVFDREQIVAADIDLAAIREESMTLDVTGHYSRPDCFEFRPRRGERARA
jgi:predicted amidohydrolase